MELGGKDAAIILKDADLELAASNIIVEHIHIQVKDVLQLREF